MNNKIQIFIGSDDKFKLLDIENIRLLQEIDDKYFQRKPDNNRMNNSSSQVNMIKKVHQTVQNMIAEAKHIIKPSPNHSSLSKDRNIYKQICLPPVKIGTFLKRIAYPIQESEKKINTRNSFPTTKIQENKDEYSLFSLKGRQKLNKNQQIFLSQVKGKSYNASLSSVESQLLNKNYNFRRCSKRYSLMRAQIKRKQVIKSSRSNCEQLDQSKYTLSISNQDLLRNKAYSNKIYTTIQSKYEKESSLDSFNQKKRKRKRRVRIATLQIQKRKGISQKYADDKYSPWQTAEDQEYLL